ncbi:MAG: HAD family hydrolase [Deltaproteobacteria bacterium]|nr:MAG: HAD family hydrolase [Deltaproteobacteria bacterium]
MKAILFDLDGTLADSIRLILASFRHACRAELGRSPEDAFWLRHIGGTLRQQFLAAGAPEARIGALEAAYRDFYVARHDHWVEVFPGVHGLLDALAARRIAVGLVTSKSRVGARRTLIRCGLAGRFAVEITADDTQRHKPHPDPLFAALEALDADPEETLYLGDAPQDIEAGRRAGTRTAAALWGALDPRPLLQAGPDHALRSPADLLDLLEGRGKS